MRKILFTVLIPVGLVAGIVTSFALATASLGVTSTPLAAGTLDPVNVKVKTGAWKGRISSKGISQLSVTENRVLPGGSFGWHSHPGPSLVIVKSGTSTFYRGDDPDCTPEVHPAGTSYVDPGGVVHIARNEGKDELVLLVTRLIPNGAPARIDEPDPGNCNF
jgi:quercetin dioxygenase-like cupin family protein